MKKCRIFEEGNEGVESFERKINSFLFDREDIEIISTNMVTEVVDNIHYKSVIIFYEE